MAGNKQDSVQSLLQNKLPQDDTRLLCHWLYIILNYVFHSCLNLNLFNDVTCFPDALKSPVYRYLVTYTPSKQADASSWLPFHSRFAFHLLDSLAFFEGLEMVLGTLSPADMNFQEMITKYFVHFAKEGKINVRFPILITLKYNLLDSSWFSDSTISHCCALSHKRSDQILSKPLHNLTGRMPEEWPEFPSHVALLDKNVSFVKSYSRERCDLWEQNGFYSYAWINWATSSSSVVSIHPLHFHLSSVLLCDYTVLTHF